MADDAQITISMLVDTSGLSDAQAEVAAGASDLADTYSEAADQIGDAQEAILDSSAALADSQTAFANDAINNTHQSIDALNEYQTALQETTTQLDELSTAQAEASSNISLTQGAGGAGAGGGAAGPSEVIVASSAAQETSDEAVASAGQTASNQLDKLSGSADEAAEAQEFLAEQIDASASAVDILTTNLADSLGVTDQAANAQDNQANAAGRVATANAEVAQSTAAVADANAEVATSADVAAAALNEEAAAYKSGLLTAAGFQAIQQRLAEEQAETQAAVGGYAAAYSSFQKAVGASADGGAALEAALTAATESGLGLTAAFKYAVANVAAYSAAAKEAAVSTEELVAAEEKLGTGEEEIALMPAAMAAFNSAVAESADEGAALNEAFDAATASGLTEVEALQAAVGGLKEYKAEAAEAAEATDALATAEDDVATAATAAGTAVQAAGVKQVESAYEARAAQIAAAAAQKEAATEANQLAIRQAQAEANVGAATAEAGQIAVTGASAANDSMRILTGSMFGAARGAAQFLNNVLKLGPFLQAAFPVIGAVALLSIVYQVGEAIIDTIKKAQEAGDAIAEAYGDEVDHIEETTDSINLQNSKLQDQIDKLEGHPSNGLQTALEDDIVAADKLADSLDAAWKKIIALEENKTLQITFTESLISNQAQTGPTTDAAEKITNAADIATMKLHTAYVKELEIAGTDQAKILAATKKYDEGVTAELNKANGELQPLLDKQVDMQKKAVERRQIIKEILEPSLLAEPLSIALKQTDYSAAINQIEGAKAIIDAEQENMKAAEKTEPLIQRKNELDQIKQNSELQKQADAAHLQALETEFELENTIGATYKQRTASGTETVTTTAKMKPQEAAAFWQQYLGSFAKGSSEYREILSKIEAEQGKFQESMANIGKAGETVGEIELYWSQVTGAYAAGSDKMLQLAASVKDAMQHQGTASPVQRELTAETQALEKQWKEDQDAIEELGKVADGLHKKMQDIQKATDKEAASAAEDTHETNLTAIQGKEGAVEQQQTLGIIDPTKALEELRDLHEQEAAEDERFLEQEGSIYSREPEMVSQIASKIEEAHRKGLETQLKDTTKILAQESEEFKKVYGAIAQDVNGAIREIITTTESPAQAFAKMLDQLLGQLATFVLEFLEKKAEMWAETHILDMLGLTQQKTTQGAANVATVQGDAAVAAANTMAYYTAFDPVVAPAAAAAAFATTEAFSAMAAFEMGGIVAGRSGMATPIIAHAGERVLSQPQTQNFEKMVNQPSKPASNFNLNYYGQVNAYDQNGMRNTLKSHADDILDIVREGYGRGSLRI